MKNVKKQKVEINSTINKFEFVLHKIVKAIRGFFQQAFKPAGTGILSEPGEERIRPDGYPAITLRAEGTAYCGGWDWLVRLNIVEPESLEFKFICERFDPVPMQLFNKDHEKIVIPQLHVLELLFDLVKMGLSVPVGKLDCRDTPENDQRP